MSPSRRSVRVADSFFTQLDHQLPASRGPRGEPSATDFLVIDLPPVVERFATGFDALPEVVDGFTPARMLISSGVLVSAFAIYGLLTSDGSIELIGIEFDLP